MKEQDGYDSRRVEDYVDFQVPASDGFVGARPGCLPLGGEVVDEGNDEPDEHQHVQDVPRGHHVEVEGLRQDRVDDEEHGHDYGDYYQIGSGQFL